MIRDEMRCDEMEIDERDGKKREGSGPKITSRTCERGKHDPARDAGIAIAIRFGAIDDPDVVPLSSISSPCSHMLNRLIFFTNTNETTNEITNETLPIYIHHGTSTKHTKAYLREVPRRQDRGQYGGQRYG